MSNYSNINAEHYAQVFKAISNPNRLKILLHFMRCCTPGTLCDEDQLQSFCVSEIGDVINVSQSTLSHHLKELTQVGLLQTERKGQKIYCSLNVDLLETIKLFFDTKLGANYESS